MMRSLLLILTMAFSLHASLEIDLLPAVERFLPTINQLNQPVSTISIDGRLGLPLYEVYNSLFRALKHRSERIRIDQSNQSPVRVTGSFFFNPSSRELAVELFLFHGDVLKERTGRIDITSSRFTALPDFSLLFDSAEEERYLLYRGYVGDRIERLIAAGAVPDILTKYQDYRIEGRNGGLSWREQVVIEKLASSIGIKVNTDASSIIRFDTTGALSITAGSYQHTISALLPSYHNGKTSLRPVKSYLSAVNSHGYESFERVIPSLNIEKNILGRLHDFFESEYEDLFNNFSASSLRSLFTNQKAKSILSGSVHHEQDSLPFVGYKWISPEQWISGLQSLHSRGRRFNVSCDVVEIIQDPHEEYRFWAVVHQRWKTMDNQGKVRYEDSGYLLVNLDFSPEGELYLVEFHYRLWFYDYFEYTTQFSEEEIGELMKKDVTQNIAVIKGVDFSLKEVVKEAIFHSLSL